MVGNNPRKNELTIYLSTSSVKHKFPWTTPCRGKSWSGNSKGRPVLRILLGQVDIIFCLHIFTATYLIQASVSSHLGSGGTSTWLCPTGSPPATFPEHHAWLHKHMGPYRAGELWVKQTAIPLWILTFSLGAPCRPCDPTGENQTEISDLGILGVKEIL